LPQVFLGPRSNKRTLVTRSRDGAAPDWVDRRRISTPGQHLRFLRATFKRVPSPIRPPEPFSTSPRSFFTGAASPQDWVLGIFWIGVFHRHFCLSGLNTSYIEAVRSFTQMSTAACTASLPEGV
jgi:hypothetical protein